MSFAMLNANGHATTRTTRKNYAEDYSRLLGHKSPVASKSISILDILPLFRCTIAPPQLAVSVGWLVGWSVGNANV